MTPSRSAPKRSAGGSGRGDGARRPPRRGLRSRPPIATAPAYESLEITNHRQLATKQSLIFDRLNAHPDLAMMVLINPVLAFAELGVKLSASAADHVLHTVQHPPAVRQRREALEKKLREAAGEPPDPGNPRWVSRFLFEKLRLSPLVTDGHAPEYVPALNARTIERLLRRRPALRPQQTLPRPLRGTALMLAPWQPARRRLDLDAPLPRLEPARGAPREVTLEQLYFYKGSHPLVRDLLELAILRARAFPVHSGDSYRRIRTGEKPNAFRSWVTKVRFTPKPPG